MAAAAVFEIFKVYVPACNMPLVNVKIPFDAKVILPFMVTPLVLLIVRFLRFEELEGINIPAADPPKTRPEEDVVVRFAGVPAIAGPFKVRVFAPTVKKPEESVRFPPTVTLPHNVTALLIVRLFNVTPGKLAVPEPPIIIFEVAPPTSVPQFI